MELSIVIVANATSNGDGSLRKAAPLRCNVTLVLHVSASEPTLEDGTLLRRHLDNFDLLWLDVATLADDSALLALVAAANAIDLPVFARGSTKGPTVDLALRPASTVTDAVNAIRATDLPNTPSGSLDRLQRHYARMAAIRGYGTSSPQDTLLLLTEELGELAHALRMHVGLGRGHLARNLKVSEELADVQLYLLHLANITSVRLDKAVQMKESLNHARWRAENATRMGQDGPKYLAIEGLIGSGKTTIARLVASHFGVDPTLEEVDNHPFLARFYEDPPHYAIEVELAFILMRWHALRDTFGGKAIVADFAPFKDLVFSAMLLEGYDLDLVRHLYDHFWQRAPRPSLTVFLDLPPDVALERIRRRGRPYEASIDIGYLEALRASYFEHFKANPGDGTILPIQASQGADEVASLVLATANVSGF